MDHTNIQDKPCLNRYSEEEYERRFGWNNAELKKCNECPYMTVDDGLIVCKLFSRKD